MEAIFDSLGKPIYKLENGHTGYLMNWHMIAPFCKKWSKNRDTDMLRVNEMLEFYKGGGYIPQMIHLAELQTEGIVCYDGNHRKEVFDRVGADIPVIIDVLFKATPDEVFQAFNNINKAVQLPAIYVEEPDVKQDIIKLVRDYEVAYKPFLSTSPRFHAPNFTRDSFTDNIYNIYKSFQGSITISRIGELLKILNSLYSQEHLCRPHSSYKSSIIEKCKKYNMWLFLDRYIPCEHIHSII
jgi:hypothetical protein